MKTCDHCGVENADEARTCVNCGDPLDIAGGTESGSAAAAPRRETLKLPPRTPAAAAARAVQRRPGDRGEGQANGENGAAPEDESREERLERALQQVEDSGRFAIGVIGFATSGKTFFIHRLKRFMREEGEYEPEPPPPKEGSVVQGTVLIEAHEFELNTLDQPLTRGSGAASGKAEPFWLIDIPGERFRQALEVAVAGEDAVELIRVLRMSHALIIVLPADEALAAPVAQADHIARIRFEAELDELGRTPRDNEPAEAAHRRTELIAELERTEKPISTERRMSELLANIAKISALARKGAPDGTNATALAGEPNENPGTQATRRPGRSPFTFVALAKADLLIEPENGAAVRQNFPHILDPGLLDSAPAQLMRLHRRQVHARIAQAFEWHKFDFVSSFAGQPADDPRIYYRLNHYGVAAVVDWILWARDYSKTARRRSSEGVGRWAQVKRFVERVEGRATRVLGRWHDEGSLLQPEEMGLDPSRCPASQPSWFERIRTVRSKSVRALLRPGSLLPRAIFAASVAAATAASFFLSPIPHSSAGTGFAFDLSPVYPAEIRRLEEENRDYARGRIAGDLRRWRIIPSDGGWFSFRVGSEARRALEQAMRQIPEGTIPSAEAAQEAAENLGRAASSDPSQVRAANSYHRGLIEYLGGRHAAAAEAFTSADAAIEEVLRNPPQSSVYDRTAARVPAAQLVILNALGVAHLEAGDPAAAAAALRRARAVIDESRPRIIDPADVSRLWFNATTREPQPMVRIPTAEIWTNLLAALIRLHGSAADPTAAESLRRELAALVATARERADEAADHPALAANLLIAAARVGDMQALSSLYVPDGAPPEVAIVSAQAQAMANPRSSDLPAARYWGAVSTLKELLQQRTGYSGRGATAGIERVLAEHPDERPALREWLADVVETEYDESSGAARRALTLNYGQYYRGSAQLRDWEARAPLGLLWFAAITLLLATLLWLLQRSFRRVRATYHRLYDPQHRRDRLEQQQG